jgi:hypothetical protein
MKPTSSIATTPTPAPPARAKEATVLQRAFYADANAAIRMCRREDLPLLWGMKAGFWRDSMTPELFEMLEDFYELRLGLHSIH